MDLIANIEAALACAAVTLPADEPSAFFFFAVFLSVDGQIAVFKRDLYIFFLKSRKFNFHLVSVRSFSDICLHQVLSSAAVHLLFHFFHIFAAEKRIIEKVIEKITVK